MKQFYNLDDAARVLRVQAFRIVHLLNTGKVPVPQRIGGKRIFTIEDLWRCAEILGVEDAQEVEYRSKSQERNQTRTNISSNSNRTDRSAADTVDIKLVLQLQIGMTEAEVQGILGEPHEVKKIEVPGFPAIGTSDRTLVSWIYNPGGKSFIVLLFENGVLQDGGTGGFSLKHGLNLVLPKGVIGN